MNEYRQLQRDEIAQLVAEGRDKDLEAARKRGQLSEAHGREVVPTQGQIGEATVKRLFAQRRYQEIEAARERGQLNDLLNGKEAGR